MTDLVADAAVWRDRARVADEAAAELDSLATGLRIVMARNSFGHGCVEGETLHSRLREVVQSIAGEIHMASAEAHLHAATCRAAADSYVTADNYEPS